MIRDMLPVNNFDVYFKLFHSKQVCRNFEKVSETFFGYSDSIDAENISAYNIFLILTLRQLWMTMIHHT